VLAYADTHSNTHTAKHFNIHPSMICRWKQQHTRINNTQTPPTAIKPGAGKRPLHPHTEEQVYSNSVALRQQGICVSLAGIARGMLSLVYSQVPHSRHLPDGLKALRRDTRTLESEFLLALSQQRNGLMVLVQ